MQPLQKWGIGQVHVPLFLPWCLVFLENSSFSLFYWPSISVSLSGLSSSKCIILLLSCQPTFSQEITTCSAITLHTIYGLATPKCISATQTYSFGWLKCISNFWKQTLDIHPKICFPLCLFIHLSSTQFTRLFIPKTWESTFIPYPEFSRAADKLTKN